MEEKEVRPQPTSQSLFCQQPVAHKPKYSQMESLVVSSLGFPIWCLLYPPQNHNITESLIYHPIPETPHNKDGPATVLKSSEVGSS